MLDYAVEKSMTLSAIELIPSSDKEKLTAAALICP